MNGKIWVESKVGLGSTFRFKIYLPIDIRQQYLAEQKAQQLSISKHVIQAQDLKPSKPLHILLVDDAPDNRLIIKKFLNKLPHKVETAENGEEAINAFIRDEYDLVFMDIQMPVMDGYTATKQIRTWERVHHKSETPIIAFTAHAFEDDIIASKEAGCTDHLSKPIKRAKLMSIIEKYSLELNQ